MTIEEFLVELKSLRRTWSLSPNTLRLEIRTEIDCLCPILAVYRSRHRGRFWSNRHWRGAAMFLGLSESDAALIQKAADWNDYEFQDSERTIQCRALRRQLLELI